MMYDALSEVYDFFAYDFDYGLWTDKYEALIKAQNPSAREICDCGCGTGSIAVQLSKRGYKVTGVDLSSEMLARAGEKARREGVHIPFVRQDMRLLTLPHPVDALFCACDGVNYLRQTRDAAAFFARAHECLKPGGAFAFDISSASKLRAMAETGLFAEDDEDKSYIWQNSLDKSGSVLTMNLSLFIKQQNGMYLKKCETHVQRVYSVKDILPLLEQAGFENVLTDGADSDERVYFSARKA